MRTAIRSSNAGFGTFDYQRSRIHRRQPGNRQTEKKKAAPIRKHNGFLTQKIRPIAPGYLHLEPGEEVATNVTTKENFDYLYRSALRYTQLMGVELPFRKRKGSNPRINIIDLYNTMDNILSEHLNLDIVGGKLHFCLYRFHQWPDLKLFWIPIEFTERLPRQLKKITLEFIQRLVRHHGIQDITETSSYEMGVEYLADYKLYNEEAPPLEVKECKSLAKSYKNGKIHRALERMNKEKFCADLEKEMRKYHTEKKNERKLLKLIGEGMTLITPDSPCLMRYCYDWAYEESPDFEPAGLDEQVMLAYSTDDRLCEEMVSYFNSNCQESYALTPVTRRYLTPETEKRFNMDDYPEKLAEWLDRFINHVSNNF